MSTKLTRRKIFTMLFVSVVAAGQTGCQSGWKMPSASIFPWSKKPSESALAGSNPSVTAPTAKTGSFASGSASPTSPASNNTPALLSSSGARPTSPYSGAFAGNRSTVPTASDFATPQNNPTAGLAANANGYQTGPYSMGGTKTGLTAPSAFGGSGNVAANQPPAGFAPATGFNPANGAAPVRQVSSGLAYAPPAQQQPQFNQPGLPAANGFGAPNGLPAQSLPTNVAANGLPANQAFGNPGLPSAPGMTPGMAPGMNNAGMVPNGVASNLPAGMSSTNMASLPQAAPSFSMPNAGPAGAQAPVQAATASYSGASPYRPGSTSRSTAYDFSRQPANGAAGATNVPHTATGLPPAPQPNVFR